VVFIPGLCPQLSNKCAYRAYLFSPTLDGLYTAIGLPERAQAAEGKRGQYQKSLSRERRSPRVEGKNPNFNWYSKRRDSNSNSNPRDGLVLSGKKPCFSSRLLVSFGNIV
jgi:hypothetical protein